MTVALTNLSDAAFDESRNRLNKSALQYGVDRIFSYAYNDILHTQFYKENIEILSQKRGLGFWLWKSHILLESLEKLEDGDIIIYSDCGIEIVDSLAPLIKICKEDQDILLFANGNLKNAEWTKRDCFILMDADNQPCKMAVQCDASFALFRKSKKSTDFLKKWLQFGSDERIITDLPNTLGKRNSWRYIHHRWDQSILSILAVQHKLPLYRMPTQFGNHYKMAAFRVQGEFNCISQKNLKQRDFYAKNPYLNSPYFQLLNHHRSTKRVLPTERRTFFDKLERKIREWL